MFLTEYAKSAFNEGKVHKATIIETIARISAWLNAMDWTTIQGNAYSYNTEGALPGVAFRGIGESFTASTGVINPATEALRIAGGDLKFDNFLMRTMGDSRRAFEEQRKVKALFASVTTKLIKGDSTSDPREFDGLQVRLTGDQLIAAGTTDAGNALSLAVLDEAIDAVPGANALLLNRALRRRFQAALRDQTLSGNIALSRDDFGRPLLRYNDLPLLVPYPQNDGVEPLAFDEAGDVNGTPAGTSSTSLYVVKFGPLGSESVSGIQSAPIDVRRLGEMHTEPQQVSRVEWDISLVVEHGKAAARLGGISNAAIVA